MIFLYAHVMQNVCVLTVTFVAQALVLLFCAPFAFIAMAIALEPQCYMSPDSRAACQVLALRTADGKELKTKVFMHVNRLSEFGDMWNRDRTFQKYLDDLMSRSRSWRKAWSYNGAVRSIHGEEVHWMDERTGIGYRDPCNAIYAKVFGVVLLDTEHGRACEYKVYNEGTRGDILEATLGFSFAGRTEFDDLRDMIEQAVRDVEAIELLLPNLHFDADLWVDAMDDLRITLAREGVV